MKTPGVMLVVAAMLPITVLSHGALYVPSPRNAGDGALPEFMGGKSILEACTCNNGNAYPGKGPGGAAGAIDGCPLGIRGPGQGRGDGQSCLWWSQGCSIGCDQCATETYGTKPITGNPPQSGKAGFRKRYCESTLEPTLPRHAWTLNMDAVEGAPEDSYRFNPWRAPGYAPVVDPCGIAGGEHPWQKMGGDSVFANTSFASKGMKGTSLKPTPRAERPVWKAGTAVEVAWGIRYNHGGGYSYRLCPAGESLTEECFERGHLEFDRSKQALKWNDGKTVYPMGDKAIFVDGNITKNGKTWARNPVPRIWDSKAGLHNPEACPGPTTRAQNSPPGCIAFPAPCPWDTYVEDGLLPCGDNGTSAISSQPKHGRTLRCDGDGMSQCASDWVVGVISDHVLIPEDLPAGDYVLGWRWDAEETAQVWQNCADVIIQR